ncbi:MAG: hypothetical protein EOS54_14165 [Mesorhizobium sp.]|uniref:hypothetical protein n=1 Tax=unclassified Mesorhizobium TaxID=325217 RepID=UPI000F7582DC|nr:MULTISPECIES: hypothetical protein [unclassified Mesorhizobium]RVD70736.1 hypothetical protein EN751_19095 [Mesorhizobium sp. M4A.F.Ca.ET.029.04.2.1]AZO51540.1 hypothetical protein EJ073_30235 [Mesorhizobium sp. M4B.F.Ca.ET.058.02.1.1]RVC46230.1 hypothetical protein EN781_06485 [Mesorhizobium sp. M4A.F.Ca.ET.090.04.2.1]RWC52923.1 MAG: hypothetical protein EOS54_14165 [Mesorhizobium sp.]RWD16492.1 MAG: hypothetical protein EOS74_05325 [Mesorhizobium sp.]
MRIQARLIVGLFEWIAAKVSEVSAAPGANRCCDGRTEADLTCFLRSFVLLAPQSAMGFLCK